MSDSNGPIRLIDKCSSIRHGISPNEFQLTCRASYSINAIDDLQGRKPEKPNKPNAMDENHIEMDIDIAIEILLYWMWFYRQILDLLPWKLRPANISTLIDSLNWYFPIWINTFNCTHIKSGLWYPLKNSLQYK